MLVLLSMNTRLIVDHIEVYNFKSYSGLNIIGPFHRNFTCVIGPNGSGKSNVIDSLLFVFGKNSKKLRLEKLNELIHNSTKDPANSYHKAYVTVHFEEVMLDSDYVNTQVKLNTQAGLSCSDNSDPARHWRPVIDTQTKKNLTYTVKRDVNRNGVSNYYLNSKKVTQKEVISFLKGKGVDLDNNRFLILQGEVEQIAMLKTKKEKDTDDSLIDYLDNIIGTDIYKEQISTFESNNNALQEDRLLHLETLQRLKQELATMEEAKKETIQYVIKDNDLQILLSIMCQLRKLSLEKEIEKPLYEIEIKEKTINEIKESIQLADEKLSKLTSNLSDEKTFKDQVQKEITQLNKNYMTQEHTHEELRVHLELLSKNKKKEEVKLSKLMQDIEILTKNMTDLTCSIKAIESKAETINTELTTQLNPRYDSLQEQIEVKAIHFRRDIAEIQKSLNPIHLRLVEKQNILEEKQAQINLNQKYQEEKEMQLDKIKKQIIDERHSQSEKKKDLEEINDLVKQITGTTKEVNRLNQELSSVTAQKFSINDKIKMKKMNFENTRENDKFFNFFISKLSEINELNNDDKQNSVFYFGSLKSLGEINDKFQLCLSVACGNILNYHVVRNEKTAVYCTQLLRKYNMGRSSFLILETLYNNKFLTNQLHAHLSYNCEGRADKLIALVKPIHSIFQIAFYYAIKNTLVTDTLDIARHIAYSDSNKKSNYRVVTINGELIDAAGTISAGGTPFQICLKPNYKLQNALDNNLEYAAISSSNEKQSKDSIKTDLSSLHSELLGFVQEEERLNTLIGKLNNQLQSNYNIHRVIFKKYFPNAVSFKIASIEQQQQELSKTIEAITARLDLTNETLASLLEKESNVSISKNKNNVQLYSEIDETNVAIGVIQGEYDVLKNKETNILAQIEALGGNEYINLKNNINSLKKDLNGLKELLNTQKASQLKLVQQHKNKERELKLLKIEMTKSDSNTMEEIKSQLNRTKGEMNNLNQLIDEAKKKIGQLNDKILCIEQEIDKQKEHNRMCKNELDMHTKDLLDLKHSISDSIEQIEKYKSKMLLCDEKVIENLTNYGLETLPEGSNLDLPRNKRNRSNIEAEDMDLHVISTFTSNKTPDELSQYKFESCNQIARELALVIKNLKEKINLNAIKYYRDKKIECTAQAETYQVTLDKLNESEKSLEQLQNKRKSLFITDFNKINKHLKEIYQFITQGGDAELELLDQSDPFEGINFVVRPPRKSWKIISNLSGGEKTLSSLSLIFALQYTKPTPIYVLDEIDAALDYKNVAIVAKYITEFGFSSQFIIISLRNNMFELAHRLVGISKIYEQTQSVTIDPQQLSLKVLK